MAVWHLRAKRKPTGGKLKPFGKKKLSERGSEFLGTSIGAKRVKARVSSGGGMKINIYSSDVINVVDKENGQWKKAKIVTVVENPANPHFVRRNIITRGAVVKTDIGLVRVTSRPGQDGTLNGILVKKAG